MTRLSSHWLWLESSHHRSQRDSSWFRVTKNHDSCRVIDSSHAITGHIHSWFANAYNHVFFRQCLFCLMKQRHWWSYFTFSQTRLAEVLMTSSERWSA